MMFDSRDATFGARGRPGSAEAGDTVEANNHA